MHLPPYEQWLLTRPEAVQAIGWFIRPGDRLVLGGEILYLLGFGEYEEGVGLIVSRVDPAHDYEGAKASRVYICPKDTKTILLEWNVEIQT